MGNSQLSRLQKTLKPQDSLSRRSGKMAKSVTGQPSSSASEGTKGQHIQSQRDVFLEEIRPVTHGSTSTISAEAKTRDEVI